MGKAKIEYYESFNGNWYWRLKAANNKIMLDSGEGYSTKSNCKRAINRVIKYMNGRMYIEEV